MSSGGVKGYQTSQKICFALAVLTFLVVYDLALIVLRHLICRNSGVPDIPRNVAIFFPLIRNRFQESGTAGTGTT